jgi:hypothetical protein
LVIPGPVAGVTAGTPVTATLTANFKGAAPGTETTVVVGLTPQASPISAVLRGPSGDVRADRPITLNAASSVDPDDPSNNTLLEVEWNCQREDFPNPCFTGTDFGTQSGLTWTIPAGLLSPDLKHLFTVNLAKGTDPNKKEASAFLVVTPKAAAIPTGRLVRVCAGAACPKKHSADVPLALSLVTDAASAGATVAWTSDQVKSINSSDGELIIELLRSLLTCSFPFTSLVQHN